MLERPVVQEFRIQTPPLDEKSDDGLISVTCGSMDDNTNPVIGSAEFVYQVRILDSMTFTVQLMKLPRAEDQLGQD